MPQRYIKIKNRIECQTKYQKGVLVVKKCKRINDGKPVPKEDIFKALGIRRI